MMTAPAMTLGQDNLPQQTPPAAVAVDHAGHGAQVKSGAAAEHADHGQSLSENSAHSCRHVHHHKGKMGETEMGLHRQIKSKIKELREQMTTIRATEDPVRKRSFSSNLWQ
jgi:hypothetical protein